MFGTNLLRGNPKQKVLSTYSAGALHQWFPDSVNFVFVLSDDVTLKETRQVGFINLTPRSYDLPEEYCVDPYEGWVYTGVRQTLADLTEMELYDELDKAMEVISKEEYLEAVQYAIERGLSQDKVDIALEGPVFY